MKKVGFLLNYDPNSWLGGFNVKKNLVNSFNFIKKKKTRAIYNCTKLI